jgi:RHH-type rel operon transcriptional repressor/antitoxin RelB
MRQKPNDILVYQNYRSSAMLAVRLPVEVESRLDSLAKATGRTKTFYVREAILEHLDDIEDLYLAESRLIEIRAGRSRTYTMEEVEQRLGLVD